MAMLEKVNHLLYPEEEKKQAVQQKTNAYLTNPFLRRDGALANKYLDYQSIVDDSATNDKVKKYIAEATGITPTIQKTADVVSGKATSGGQGGGNVSGLNAATLAKMDIATELPKLSEAQISKLISTHFSKSSVISPTDAAGIKAAQDKTGMSALAILGIGALESGYGTSNIANKTGNLWGYGATNTNPLGNAHRYGKMAEGSVQYASEFMKDYYNGYGAKSIYSAGSGDNPAGKGYAYFDNGSINSGWVDNVSSIMAKFCGTLSSAGLGGGTTSGSTSSGGNAFVNTAKQYIGTPYVWGGTSPKGFDCSGLVQYAYAQNGVKIPRVAKDQFKSGKAVDSGNLQLGDLVFFKGSNGNAAEPGHVGMYVGNGQYIHSPQTGDTVKISNLSGRKDYVGARRYY